MPVFDWEPRKLWVGDCALACYVWGEGEPIIFLHGNGEDSRYFARQLPTLAKQYQVIALDSRGHGQSDRGTLPLTIEQMARDLCHVMKVLKLQKAHILGFSDGGNVAIQFALKYPRCVDRLILNGANIHMLSGVKASTQLPLYPAALALRLGGMISEELWNKYEILSLMTHDYGVDWADLRSIQAKTLVLTGEHDMIRDRHSWRMALCLPHGRMERIPGGDHFCAFKLPNQFNLAVLRFLKEE